MLTQYAVGGQTSRIMQALYDWGFIDALIPFILFFAIIFTLLEQMGLFDEKKINGILAFTISALIVIPHITRSYPPGADPIVIISSILPQSLILLGAILFVLLMAGVIGAKIPSTLIWTVGIIGVVILITIVLGASFPTIQYGLGPLNNPDFLAIVIALLVVGITLFFLLGSGTPSKGWKGIVKDLMGEI